MKTTTILWGKSISSEIIEIAYNKTDKGYILINSLETPEGTEYWCQDNIFDEALTYEVLRTYIMEWLKEL